MARGHPFKKWLDPIPTEHHHHAAAFDAASREALRNAVFPVLMLGSAVPLFLILTDLFFYRESFVPLLFTRVMLPPILWLSALLSWRRRRQRVIYRLTLTVTVVAAALLGIALFFSQDPTGPYLLTLLSVMALAALAHWPTNWTIWTNLAIVILYAVTAPFSEAVEDLAQLLFYCILLLAWAALFTLVHIQLTRQRWQTFLNRTRLEALTSETKDLQKSMQNFDEQLELKVRERTAELRDAYEKLELLDQSKTDFIQLISHELRTPMTVFTGYSQILLSDLTIQQNPTLAEIAAKIQSSSEQLSEIVNTMLDVVRIDSDMLQLNIGLVSLDSVFAKVRMEYQDVLQKRDLTLEVEGLSALPNIEGDAAELSKVFRCLLVNAIKYTPDGGKIAVSGQEWPEGEDLPSGGAKIVFSDTGIGIAPENHERIFSKLQSTTELALHSSGKTTFKAGGLGLGLAIARGIVEAHGGKIWVESPGYDEESCPGSHFHVVLPRVQ
jgi:signal transduction histidine kinase